MKRNILFLFCLTILLSNNGYSQSKTEVNKEFDGVSFIDISTISGNCTIKRGDGKQVEVMLVSDYRPAKSFEPVFSQEGDVLLLKEKMNGSNSGYSEWTITVPQQTNIRFKSASGSISIGNIAGKMKFSTASGNIDANGIIITDNSAFSSASGNVSIKLKESPGFDVLVSSASGYAALNFNQNPVIGNIEMRARIKLGVIVCPFKFDEEKEIDLYNQKYMIKSLMIKDKSPEIKIYTASGKAELKK
jgi:hypothetical protein